MTKEDKYPVWHWCNTLGVDILDPDGFRDLPNWRDQNMTREEFERRLARSTCRLPLPTPTPTRTRGFEAIKGYQVINPERPIVAQMVPKTHYINLPKRSTKNAAGYDFEASEDVTIPPVFVTLIKCALNLLGRGSDATHADRTKIVPTLVPTGIKAYMPQDEALLLFNRSSGPLKRFLLLSNGVGLVDSDFFGNETDDGHIRFQFLNFGLFPITIKKGDRIGQGMFIKYLKADGDRTNAERIGGHGSTGN